MLFNLFEVKATYSRSVRDYCRFLRDSGAPERSHPTGVAGDGLGDLPKNLQSLVLSLVTGRKDEKPRSARLRVEKLAALTHLRELDLGRRDLTDADLQELARLKKLEKLNLSFTKVTEAGVAKLRQALPRCEVQYLK